MTSPAWWRYANEPDVLERIIAGHYREMIDRPADSAWFLAEIADIEAHLRRSKVDEVVL